MQKMIEAQIIEKGPNCLSYHCCMALSNETIIPLINNKEIYECFYKWKKESSYSSLVRMIQLYKENLTQCLYFKKLIEQHCNTNCVFTLDKYDENLTLNIFNAITKIVTSKCKYYKAKYLHYVILNYLKSKVSREQLQRFNYESQDVISSFKCKYYSCS